MELPDVSAADVVVETMDVTNDSPQLSADDCTVTEVTVPNNLSQPPTVNENGSYCCPMCPAIIQRQSLFVSHMYRHINFDVISKAKPTFSYHAERYHCDVCSLKTESRLMFQEHVRAHIVKQPYVCLHCGVSAEVLQQLIEHSDRQHPKRVHNIRFKESDYADNIMKQLGPTAPALNTRSADVNTQKTSRRAIRGVGESSKKAITIDDSGGEEDDVEVTDATNQETPEVNNASHTSVSRESADPSPETELSRRRKNSDELCLRELLNQPVESQSSEQVTECGVLAGEVAGGIDRALPGVSGDPEVENVNAESSSAVTDDDEPPMNLHIASVSSIADACLNLAEFNSTVSDTTTNQTTSEINRNLSPGCSSSDDHGISHNAKHNHRKILKKKANSATITSLECLYKDGKYICQSCPKRFCVLNAFRKHAHDHLHVEKKTPCSSCGQKGRRSVLSCPLVAQICDLLENQRKEEETVHANREALRTHRVPQSNPSSCDVTRASAMPPSVRIWPTPDAAKHRPNIISAPSHSTSSNLIPTAGTLIQATPVLQATPIAPPNSVSSTQPMMIQATQLIAQNPSNLVGTILQATPINISNIAAIGPAVVQATRSTLPNSATVIRGTPIMPAISTASQSACDFVPPPLATIMISQEPEEQSCLNVIAPLSDVTPPDQLRVIAPIPDIPPSDLLTVVAPSPEVATTDHLNIISPIPEARSDLLHMIAPAPGKNLSDQLNDIAPEVTTTGQLNVITPLPVVAPMDITELNDTSSLTTSSQYIAPEVEDISDDDASENNPTTTDSSESVFTSNVIQVSNTQAAPTSNDVYNDRSENILSTIKNMNKTNKANRPSRLSITQQSCGLYTFKDGKYICRRCEYHVENSRTFKRHIWPHIHPGKVRGKSKSCDHKMIRGCAIISSIMRVLKRVEVSGDDRQSLEQTVAKENIRFQKMPSVNQNILSEFAQLQHQALLGDVGGNSKTNSTIQMPLEESSVTETDVVLEEAENGCLDESHSREFTSDYDAMQDCTEGMLDPDSYDEMQEYLMEYHESQRLDGHPMSTPSGIVVACPSNVSDNVLPLSQSNANTSPIKDNVNVVVEYEDVSEASDTEPLSSDVVSIQSENLSGYVGEVAANIQNVNISDFHEPISDDEGVMVTSTVNGSDCEKLANVPSRPHDIQTEPVVMELSKHSGAQSPQPTTSKDHCTSEIDTNEPVTIVSVTSADTCNMLSSPPLLTPDADGITLRETMDAAIDKVFCEGESSDTIENIPVDVALSSESNTTSSNAQESEADCNSDCTFRIESTQSIQSDKTFELIIINGHRNSDVATVADKSALQNTVTMNENRSNNEDISNPSSDHIVPSTDNIETQTSKELLCEKDTVETTEMPVETHMSDVIDALVLHDKSPGVCESLTSPTVAPLPDTMVERLEEDINSGEKLQHEKHAIKFCHIFSIGVAKCIQVLIYPGNFTTTLVKSYCLYFFYHNKWRPNYSVEPSIK